jgi:hypothetical protein
LTGFLAGFGVGDGYASYVVLKEKPLTLGWLPGGDNWQLQDYELRGLRRDDLLRMQHFDKAWASA